MQLLATPAAGLGSLDNTFWDDLDQLHNILMTLDSLQSYSVIHENGFLVLVSFILFVKIRTLDHFKSLIFHIFLILKIDDGFIDILLAYSF